MKRLLGFSLSVLLLITSGINAKEWSNSATGDPEEYWTKERMRNATPLPPPETREEEFKDLLWRLKTPDDLRPPAPTRANLDRMPYKSAGKLFYRSDGADHYCTAQFVQKNETRNNIILTAAHCIRSRSSNTWSSDFEFCPRCRNNQGERLSWECATVHPDWLPDGRKRDENDYGFIRIDAPPPEQRALELGVPGRITSDRVMAIGYPSNYDSGRFLYVVRRDTLRTAGPILMQSNPFGTGASGGAWVQPQERRRVIGLYSRAVIGTASSPSFDVSTSQQVSETYQKAISCTPDDPECTCKPQLKKH